MEKTFNNKLITKKNIVINKMRFSTSIFPAILFFCLIVVGCSKSDNGGESDLNKFTYSGKTLEIIAGGQIFWGHVEEYGDDTNNIDLVLGNTDYIVYFEMFVNNKNNKLVAGNYELGDSYQPGTFCFGAVLSYDTKKVEYEITSGTVSIKVSGSTYTINVNGTLENGKPIVGNYTGLLEWLDGNEE